MGKRDYFRAPTRTALAYRAGVRCSNPSCRRATAKADPSNPENWIDLGVACHITAASPGGPRYDPSLSPQQRRSAINGIWLCHHCGKEVDSTTSTYTVETLRTWKAQAEACTARDAAATLDDIANLIADIESTRTTIAGYIQERQTDSPTFSLTCVSEDEWVEKTAELVRYSNETQMKWDNNLAPLVASCIVRATGLLGATHEAIIEAKHVSQFARTNLLVMKDMAENLETVRSHLLLR